MHNNMISMELAVAINQNRAMSNQPMMSLDDIQATASKSIFLALRTLSVNIASQGKLTPKTPPLPVIKDNALLQRIPSQLVAELIPMGFNHVNDAKINHLLVRDIQNYFRLNIINEVWGSVFMDTDGTVLVRPKPNTIKLNKA